MLKVGSDFSGVGAFNQALLRLGKPFNEVFACDMDKYARQTFIENYGEPEYYPTNVYEREIPQESLDVYMTSPPCQAFSMAGKRLGKEDKRGILFFNSYEFIQKNKPRFFIFENVKGLLSEDNGKTFQEWVNMLGGKSVNGLPVLFPYEESVPYHLYYKVLNAKEHGVPQNRERIFLIGIRDDKDNNFRFPVEEHLTKRLKDVLEDNVDEKYFLSEKLINGFLKHNDNHNEKGTGFIFKPKNENEIANCLRSNAALASTDNTIKVKYGLKNNNRSNFNYGCHKLNKTLDINLNKIKIDEPLILDVHNRSVHNYSPSLTEPHHNTTRLWDGYLIRKLTPREYFRLMDFPDTFTWSCSDSQAYKQAGNSIVVNVLYKILKNLPL
jgi:DNA (cytosine-5)-methyltransferase 1